MGRKIYFPEQIVRKLRKAEVLVSQGNTIGQVSRQLDITEQTYCRWWSRLFGKAVERARK